MGERQTHQIFHQEGFQSDENWTVMEGDSEPSSEDSVSCSSSSSDQDVMEDSTSSSSSSSSYGPLYELSELMAHLPIKRGLSKYYEGKSQTFASLSSLESIKDLAKKKLPSYRSRKMKSCKSVYSPKATICKKITPARVSFLPSLPNCARGSSSRDMLFSHCRPLFYVSENL